MKTREIIDGEDGSTVMPTLLPVMPEDGTGFLNGSIQSDVYLRAKRAETRAWAISEMERDRRSPGASRLVTLGLLAVVTSNLIAGIASFVGGNNKVGALGLTTAALVGMSFLSSVRMATRQKH